MAALDPLVPSGGPLPPEERRRAARHLLLESFGPAAQARLASARVLVVGAGGLGSPVLQYLAAAGVGTLGVLDDDVVEESNLQRQVLHGAGDVGSPKTASAAAALRTLRPDVRVVEHGVRLDASNARSLMEAYDLVVDGCDTFATRYAVSDAAVALGLPVVWGSVLGWDGQVAVWWSAAPDGLALTYPDVFGPAPSEEGETCATAGVLSPACGVVGATMAVEAVKLLTGTGDVALGRLLVYDARTSTWNAVELTPPSAATGPVAHSEAPNRATSPLTTVPEGALVLDVGPAAGGAAPGAVWVRLEDLAAGEHPPELVGHPHDAPVVVVCPHGLRSRGAATLLAADGWTDVRAVAAAPL
ncbi:HesA/MoeB/ThiF family protein [Isoptericola variabilis]|uniref:UBA/THIF-type NAD/FAD binding protein n=1 Tax=Isoptericola variabilis (strain 225) TaxID=743718 RepID=F6FR07_ISOV2|nr:HesA/MoeB/ThiF family protein [Isoptericola variabilis]AEG44957.1 UBA/THIF-type NAD/FAD binding protein [Isoptericola variabilis 225]TWH26031.1 adenylyltransferase/sulfurtransferase [Isoptericola variabilis J7]